MCRKVALSWPIATLFLYPHFRRIYGSSSTGRFLWPRFTFVLYLLRFMAHSMDWLLLTHWNLILKLWNYSAKKISSRGIWQKILPYNKILCLSAFGHRKQTGRLYPTHFKSLSSHVYNSNFVVDIVVVVRSEICLKWWTFWGQIAMAAASELRDGWKLHKRFAMKWS